MSPVERLGAAAQRSKNRAERVYEAVPGEFNEFPELTVLKTAAVSWYMGMYIQILRSQIEQGAVYSKSAWFVDLLGGSGLSSVRGRNLKLCGASVLAASKPFDGILACEIDRARATLLEDRIRASAETAHNEYAKPPIEVRVFADGAENSISQIREILKAHRAQFLLYVDLQGADVAWSDLEPLLRQRCDVIYNFQAAELNRNLERGVKSWERVTGVPGINKLQTEQARLARFEQQFEEAGFDRVEHIRVAEEGSSFYYYLIFASHLTRGKNPWWNLVLQTRKLVEQDVQGHVRNLLSVIEGKQSTLFDHDENIGQQRF